jgi:hypothetical protein
VSGAPDNANREAVLFAEREGPVAAGERLVVDLLTGDLIPSPLTGVDEHVSVIGIVFVAASENYGFRALRLAPGDAGLYRRVYPALAEFGAIPEETPLGVPWYVSEDAFRHDETYLLMPFPGYLHPASL